MEFNEMFWCSGSGVKQFHEWNGSMGRPNNSTNQSSTKSKCLCFVVLIDGCVALVGRPTNSFHEFELLRCSLPLLCWNFILQFQTPQRGPLPVNSFFISSARPLGRASWKEIKRVEWAGPATNQFISHKSKSSWRIALSLCTIPDWRLILL